MRESREIVIAVAGRDQGKTFVLTEMAADQAERWGIRAVLALARAGTDVPPDVMGMGMAGIAIMGITGLAGVSWEDAEPLLAEMMLCVQRRMDSGVTRRLQEGEAADIEEVSTRLLLRGEVLAMHLGFTMDALRSQVRSMVTAAAQSASLTQTSPAPSEPLSAPDSPA